MVHRRDEAVRGWRNWIREDPLVHPYRWLRPDLVLLAPFLQCEPHRTLDGSGVLSDPNQIDAEAIASKAAGSKPFKSFSEPMVVEPNPMHRNAIASSIAADSMAAPIGTY